MSSDSADSASAAPDAAAFWNVRRLLVPVDFTAASLHAIRQGAAMAARLGSSVHLLHVVDRAVLIEPALEKTSEEVVREAKQQLSALADEELKQVPHDVAVAVGVPADEILVAAETGGSDLIIMAQHEYKGLDRVLHRHTLRQVESRAHCPVLTLHCDEAGEIEPRLWKGSPVSRVGEWMGQVFLRAFGAPND